MTLRKYNSWNEQIQAIFDDWFARVDVSGADRELAYVAWSEGYSPQEYREILKQKGIFEL